MRRSVADSAAAGPRPRAVSPSSSALSTSRTTSAPKTATTTGGDEALDLAEAHLPGQPATDDAAEDADEDVGQAAARGLATHSAPEIAPARKPTTIQPRMSMSMGQSRTGGWSSARKARTASTTASGWVWCAACLAPGSPRPGRSPAGRQRPGSPRGTPGGSRHRGAAGPAGGPGEASRTRRVPLRLELADDRRGRGHASRPDRVGPVARRARLRSCRRPGS